MKRLIVNADDFGLTDGVNEGILQAHQSGIVTSATVMVNMPGAGSALALARATPSLGVGVHLTLTSGRPLCDDVPSLTGPDGRFLRLPALAAFARRHDLERELRAQVEAFLASGLKPTHLDSHHHVHLQMPAVAAIVLGLADELRIPVRGMGGAPRLVTSFYGAANVGVGSLVAILDAIADGETAEIMCHPAVVDDATLGASSYAAERGLELAALTAPAVREAVAAREIRLISYREVSAPWAKD